jgi:ferredoxin
MPRIEAETATGPQAFEAAEGRKLVLAIEDAGIDILHRCGGNAERNRLALETGLADNVRLSCQVHVADDLKVKVINQVSVRGMDAGPRPAE